MWKYVNMHCLSGSSSNYKRKRKRSDSILWQNPLHTQKIQKSNVTTQKRHQKLQLHNDCELRTVIKGNYSHPTVVVKPVNGILELKWGNNDTWDTRKRKYQKCMWHFYIHCKYFKYFYNAKSLLIMQMQSSLLEHS